MITPKRYKICRRVGDRIYPQCQKPGYTASLANRKPKGRGGISGKSDFAVQLNEKQKVRFAYGISERQFSNYVEAARHAKGTGVTAALYSFLEMRLDNVIYRMGFASSRRAARQMVSHGHITVNGTRVTIPSYQVKRQDEISVRAGSRTSSLFGNMNERLKEHRTPEWLSVKPDMLAGSIVAAPKPSEMVDSNMNLNAIVEFYSR